MSNIQIETHNDKIIRTNPIIKMDNLVEVVSEKIEIPEPSHFRDSDSEGSDFEFLANTKKILPPIQPPPVLPGSPIPNMEMHNSPKLSDLPLPEVYSSPPMKPMSFSANAFNLPNSYQSEDDIRREKSFLLNDYNSKNIENKYSPKNFTMDDSIGDIKNELEFILAKRDLDNNMMTWKRGMLLFVDGVAHLNSTYYNPFDVDLSDWSKEMHWSVFREGAYDEVLQELIKKWRGKVPMSPEMKILGMMGSSLAFGIISKKREKAAMEKRLREQQQMEERVRAQVRDEMLKVQQQQFQQGQQFQQQGHQQPQQGYQQPQQGHQQPQQGHQQQHWKEQVQVQVQVPTPQQAQTQTPHTFNGPSLTEEEMLKLMETNFIDTTIDNDSDEEDNESVISLRPEINLAIAPKKPRGRPPKKTTNEVTLDRL